MANQPVDLSEFVALSQVRSKKPPCKVGQALDQLPDGERRQLAAALEHEEVTVGAIVKWCHRRGLDVVNQSAVVSHRQRTCTCHEPS